MGQAAMTWVNGSNRTADPAWRALKRKAIRAFGNYCARCEADGDEVQLELDHITPVAEGGTDTLDNTQLLCRSCHQPKTQAEAARGRARRSPHRPPRQHPADALSPRP